MTKMMMYRSTYGYLFGNPEPMKPYEAVIQLKSWAKRESLPF
jgi:hypothetical protein